jgi:hypothetical protein
MSSKSDKKTNLSKKIGKVGDFTVTENESIVKARIIGPAEIFGNNTTHLRLDTRFNSEISAGSAISGRNQT